MKRLSVILLFCVIGLLCLFAGKRFFSRLLIFGSQLVESIGDIQLAQPDEEMEESPQPVVPTWKPGDDPSWSNDTNLVPVDKTVEELARESGGNRAGGGNGG